LQYLHGANARREEKRAAWARLPQKADSHKPDRGATAAESETLVVGIAIVAARELVEAMTLRLAETERATGNRWRSE
jgi:hypothetical protein